MFELNKKIKFLFLQIFVSISGIASTSVQRQITQNVIWTSCNSFKICYKLITNQVDIGLITNRFYTGPVTVEIFQRRSKNSIQLLKTISAEEAHWNYDSNQWILAVPTLNKGVQEFVFNPETIKN